MKVAFSGSSGSGKTTLVKFVEKEFNLTHMSGSAGDLRTQSKDDQYILDHFGGGHLGVIRRSANDPVWGIKNQEGLLAARSNLIFNERNFVTDRSPLDNLTYLISQVGYFPTMNDERAEEFMKLCLVAWNNLTHVIFVKAVQPNQVEDNGSRIPNRYYQKAIDAQFEYWLRNFFMKYQDKSGPKVLTIAFWDLGRRKDLVKNFLNNNYSEL